MHHPLLLGNSTTTTSTTSNDELYPHHGHYDDHSPFLLQDHDGVVLSYLLSQQQQHFLTIDVVSNNSSQSVAASNQGLLMEKEEEKIQKQSNRQKKKAAAGPRKRVSGKKDRHSKICTAQGPRDRRMRLSVQIARKFFDLQDMLGFDKASKTIDWLFTKSRSAIKELKQRLLLPSSSLSTTVDESTNEAAVSTTTSHTTQLAHSVRDPNKNNMRIRMCRAIGKGSRDEARARARERTRQKLRVRSSSSCCLQLEEANPKDHHHHLGQQELAAEKHNCYNAVMMKNNNNRGRPNFEDADGHGRHGGDEFPGFTSGNWSSNSNTDHRNVIKSFPHFTGNNNNNNVLQVENPKQQQQEPATTSLVSLSSSNSQLDGDQHNYSSAAGTSDFMTTTSIPLMPKPNTQPAELAVLNPSSSPIHFMPNPNSRFLTSLMISKDPHSAQFLKFN